MQALTLDMEINPGDKLALRSYDWTKNENEIVTVLRVTRTLVFIPMGGEEQAFFRRGGEKKSHVDKWDNYYLFLPTQEEIAEIEAAALLQHTRNEVCTLVVDFWKTAELEPLLEIKAIIEKAQGE